MLRYTHIACLVLHALNTNSFNMTSGPPRRNGDKHVKFKRESQRFQQPRIEIQTHKLK